VVREKCCRECGAALSRDEVGLTKKLLDANAKEFFCYGCLAEYLEVEEEFLRAKVEEFRDEGCTLF
jgi:hypothetical protein